MQPQNIIDLFLKEKITLRSYRDASNGPSLFPLRFIDCLNAMQQMKIMGLWKKEDFDHFKYDYFS